MGGFRRFSHRLAAVAAVALLAGIHPHLTSSRASGVEGASVVRGTVKDMDGNPLEGVEVGMSPIGKESKPYVVKTRNDGTFVYPFLPYNKQKYSVEFKKEGYKVRKIKIVSRQPQTSADKGEGQLIQEDEGTVGPQQQIPPVNAKPGGTVHIEIAMASREYLDKLAQAQADAASGSQPPSGSESLTATREGPPKRSRRWTRSWRLDPTTRTRSGRSVSSTCREDGRTTRSSSTRG